MRAPALVGVLWLLAACSSPHPQTCRFEGEADYASSAGCLALVHNKVLLVDSRAGGLTPPGGKSVAGEPAQCTAHRETLEETGLDLLPGRLLRVFDTGFHLYHCEIHAGSGRIDPNVLEVRHGLWLDLDDFDRARWRYPGQGDMLREIIEAEYQPASPAR